MGRGEGLDAWIRLAEITDGAPTAAVDLPAHAEEPIVEAPVEPVAAQPVQAEAKLPEASVEQKSPDADAEEASSEQAVHTPRQSRPEPVSSEADPSRPKRSGWWQRAKATITG